MTKDLLKKIIRIFMCAIVTIGLFFVMFYKPKTVYDVVVLGDSNIGNFRDETSVTYIMEKYLNVVAASEPGTESLDAKTIKVFNAGFGGATAVDLGKVTIANTDSMIVNEASFVNSDSMIVNEASFVNLANSIVNQEYSKLLADAAARDDGDLDYYDQSLRDLAAIDFNKVKVLIVAYGTNDYLAGIDENVYANAVYEGVAKLSKKYPDMKIVVVTPFYNEREDVDISSNISTNVSSEIEAVPILDIESYVEALTNECSDYYIFDAYNAGIVNKDNISERTLDGVHLNPEARRIYGEKLAAYIGSLILQ